MGLSYLEAQDLGLNELQRTAVDLDEALTSLSRHVSLSSKLLSHPSSAIITHGTIWSTDLALSDGSGRLLLAEALHTLRCRRHGCYPVWRSGIVEGLGAG